MAGKSGRSLKKLHSNSNTTLKKWCFSTVVLEKTLQRPLDSKEIKPVNPKGNQLYLLDGLMLKVKFQNFGHLIEWRWSSKTLATWFKELTHWKRPWCWERVNAGEGGDRGWDGWMVSPTGWTWVWASSRRWWWTRKPGMLQSMTERLNNNPLLLQAVSLSE